MEQGENKLRAVYEDYLGSLDELEARQSRAALERWDKFLEGRPPEEVDGGRREWFEMAQEESGLPAAKVREVSERVGRFYEWLKLARPTQPPFGGGVAKPPVTRDAGLPTPPPSLSDDPKLWVQGPSVGPPPAGPRKPAAPGGPVRNIRAIWVVVFLLTACVLGILPYMLIVTPLARLETDLSVYIRSADQEEMDGLFRWLVPRAQKAGVVLDPDAARIDYEASEAAQFGVDKLNYVDITIPGRQLLWGATREVEISARALSEFKVGRPAPPEIEAAADEAAPPEPQRESGMSTAHIEGLRAQRKRLDTAIANLRTTVKSAPAAAQALLAEELHAIESSLRSQEQWTRPEKLFGKVLTELFEISRTEKIDLKKLDNRLYKIETQLRQIDRLLDELEAQRGR